LTSSLKENKIHRDSGDIKMKLENEAVVVFDLETTGLYPRGEHPKNYHKFGRMLSIAWKLVAKKTGRVLTQQYYVIKVDKDVDLGRVDIHHITREEVDRVGVELSIVLDRFFENLNRASSLIAHNAEFDTTILKSELYRSERYSDLEMMKTKRVVCTMKLTTPILKIPSQWGGYKWPKLAELYEYLFNESFEDAHHAMADVEALTKIYKELISRGS
jgi:DNA polymerase III epsilon subunit-like protein